MFGVGCSDVCYCCFFVWVGEFFESLAVCIFRIFSMVAYTKCLNVNVRRISS